MGVYIKGMEMPKSCWVCEVGGAEQMDNATCPFYSMEYWEQENYQDKIADGCPLVPVPPHGRLIDADALDINRREERVLIDYEAAPFSEYLEGVKDGLHEAAKCVSTAPTIIPAEVKA